MADSHFTVSTPAAGVAVAADNAKHTVLQLVAPANQSVKVSGWKIGFHGIATADPPATVRILRQTSAGTTAGSAPTPRATNTIAQAIQSTGQIGVFSAEPTAGDQLDIVSCHPQWSTGEGWNPLENIVVPGGGRLGIEVTLASGAAGNAVASFRCEE